MMISAALTAVALALNPAWHDQPAPKIYGPGIQFPDAPGPRPTFKESPEVRSVDGVCKATVHIRKQEVQAGD